MRGRREGRGICYYYNGETYKGDSIAVRSLYKIVLGIVFRLFHQQLARLQNGSGATGQLACKRLDLLAWMQVSG